MAAKLVKSKLYLLTKSRNGGSPACVGGGWCWYAASWDSR